ncbi:hypothetical protein [Hydromonas duriensis]|uniref:Outer membrane beta-barrel porin/alpha-amylase n=1 Tax=Hydromonas duriensis TaxID=1527608 RepID=A0A4R6Y6I0_9BURK|nr:hypothetical protein [Hydromonas duriensis]TDR30591.1 hypothetical protein DFR44_11917 [Hydromonas duriensis]
MKKNIITIGLILMYAASFAAVANEVDNGTDPTKFSTTAAVQWERLNLLDDKSSEVLNLTYWQPLGAQKHSNIRVRLPVLRITGMNENHYAVGDFSLKYTRLLKLTPEYGVVAAGEMDFDTAERDELGTGKTVFKGSLIYAQFLKNGDIFAPSVVQSNSLWGQSHRASVNNTVFDFYYVPKFKNPKWFMTLDPAISLDWETKKQFASLAVTLGRSTGPAFGGNSQVFIKPTVFAGGERPGTWGVEVGYKVLGF